MKIDLVLSATVSAIVLSGCEASQFSTVDAALDTFNAYHEGILAEEIIDTPDMPTSGTANYTGPVAIFDITPSGNGAIGQLSLAADFGADTIGGEATDFILVKDTGSRILTVVHGVPGTLNITNGVISSHNFVADLGGTLTGVNGSRYPTDTLIEAELFGFL